jgi:hypothetical protein
MSNNTPNDVPQPEEKEEDKSSHKPPKKRNSTFVDRFMSIIKREKDITPSTLKTKTGKSKSKFPDPNVIDIKEKRAEE